MSLSYRVSIPDPANHLFDVELQLAEPGPQGQTLTLPSWIPGSYMIRDFARNIVKLEANCAGKLLDVEKTDKQTWRLPPVSGPVTVRYQVYAWDLSVRSAHLDQTHGFFNGTSLFLRVIGQEHGPHRVCLERPVGTGYEHWRVSTTLPPTDIGTNGFGHYQAPDYESLIDYPVELGTQQSFHFDAADVPHEIAISGRQACDGERLVRDLALICSQHARMFGELPVDRYLFLTLATGDGYGGLEHRDSTSLLCARDDLPRAGLGEPDEGYRRFLGLCSHEYFHLWNVKRIRPERLRQADLSVEAHTDLLWAFEGFTSYYDDLGLVRAGCVESAGYLEALAQVITRVQRGSGRHKQSVAESSFDAWTKFYKQDENAPNAIVSYYAKGALVALGLDITLRDATQDAVCLDDLMRVLWQRHGKPDIGVPEDGIAALASELAGRDLSDFFDRYVHGTAELPLSEWFRSVGIGMLLVPAESPADQGASASEAPATPPEPKPALGARWIADEGGAKLTHVLEGGAAQAAGLAAGDRIIALGGLQVASDQLAKRVAQLTAPVELHAFRRDELMAFTLEPVLAPADTAILWPLADADCTDAQRTRRASWLGQ